jgi:anti-sigma factor ChrR (cupin superfamily)
MTRKRDGAPWFIDEETDQYLAGLDLGMPAPDPPGKLWSRIAASLEGADLANTTARLSEGRWRDYAPGITVKRLWSRDTYLLKCEPGSMVPDHEHPSFEHTVVVSGELVIDGVVYGPGDYLGTPKGGSHPSWTTKAGCIVLVHYEAA